MLGDGDDCFHCHVYKGYLQVLFVIFLGVKVENISHYHTRQPFDNFYRDVLVCFEQINYLVNRVQHPHSFQIKPRHGMSLVVNLLQNLSGNRLSLFVEYVPVPKHVEERGPLKNSFLEA